MPIATYVINTGQNLSQAADARWRSERFERLIRRVQAAGVAPAPGLIEDFALPLAQGPGPAGPRRDGPLLSVAISTRGRPAGLKRLLEAVLPQTDGRADREVVVVNDGSHDAAYAAVVAPLAGRLVYRPIPSGVGLPGARNLSARLARGEFVVFVDDDCVPPPWWLDWLAALIETRPDLDAVAGTCLALAPDRPSFAAAVNTRFRFIPRPWRTGGDLMLVGANMAVRRSTYWRIGGFAMVDGWPGAGEDAEFSRRLALDGARVVAAGDWLVRHDVTAGLRTQMRRQWRYGYADPWLNRLPTGPKGLDRPERATVGGRIRIARGVFKDSYAQARGIAGSLAGRVAVAVVATLIRCSADAGYARAVRELAGGVTAPRP
jgi:glycosyltransferase involved in cell wall biosynthesis